MTERDQLIKAISSDLTRTQFECLRIVMDSLDIEPGTVVGVGGHYELVSSTM